MKEFKTIDLGTELKKINDIIKPSLEMFADDDDLIEAIFDYLTICGIKATPQKRKDFALHLIEKSQASFKKTLKEDLPIILRDQNEIQGVNGSWK